MATYSEGCSQVGGFSYADRFTLYVELTETDVNIANNTSKIQYHCYCQSADYGSISSRHELIFKLNGQTIREETVNVTASSPNALIEIASGTTGPITHNSDGSKSVYWYAGIGAETYGVQAYMDANSKGYFNLTNIPRYATCNICKIKITF